MGTIAAAGGKTLIPRAANVLQGVVEHTGPEWHCGNFTKLVASGTSRMSIMVEYRYFMYCSWLGFGIQLLIETGIQMCLD